ncbi:MAG: urea ABC transporter permease subunit UrtB [Candidatus Rokuibacteriota bacterium]|nr:MAG: urea ABC transporter permease subunit UrtB [Candidatus Rokubacteria bacterium]
MRTLVAVLAAAWVLTGLGGRAAAGPGAFDLEAAASRLAAPATQKDVLGELAGSSDPAVERLLRALKDGALYAWKGRTVLLGDDGGLTDVAGRPVLDSQGQPAQLESGAEAVALDEAHFGLVRRTLERFEVFGRDPLKRQSAAFRLGTSGDPAAIPVLARALEGETNGDVRVALEDALAKLRLRSSDAADRLGAVKRLGWRASEAAVPQLQALLAGETDPAVRAAARTALQDIDRFVVQRNAIGYLFNGVSLGAVLLLMSLGLAVTFGLMGIINMAHGEMLMLGSYAAYVVQEIFAAWFPGYVDSYFVVALPLAFLVAGVVGLALEWGVIRFLYGRPLETLIVTWGVGMILQQGARLYFGDQTSVNSPTWLRGGVEVLTGLIFPWSRIFIVVLALAALGALWLLLYRSYAGLNVRAVMQNRAMAACLGVSTRRVDAVTFSLGTALAGVAGCALALIGTVDPEVGKTYIVDSFMVVVLGGVGKLVGTVVAAVCIGVSNKLIEPAIGGTAAAVYAKVAVLVIVIWFLQWRPTGLFAQRGRAATETA